MRRIAVILVCMVVALGGRCGSQEDTAAVSATSARSSVPATAPTTLRSADSSGLTTTRTPLLSAADGLGLLQIVPIG